MADERADEFLDKYRALEEELNNRYGEDDRGYGSAVIRYLNDKESKPYREKLNICREIRNFLSHHSEIDGEKIIQPSEAIIRFVVELTEFIRRPPLAVDYCGYAVRRWLYFGPDGAACGIRPLVGRIPLRN